jgi:transposase
VVPSASLNGKYTVTRDGDGYHCTCPDHELRAVMCKHSWAVEFVIRRETAPDGTVTETRAVRLTYAQDWPSYNRAQVEEKDTFCRLLRDLVADVPAPERKRGRPTLPPADMLFAATFRVYSTVSARRFMTDLRGAARDGFIARAPHYNSLYNFIDDENLTPQIQALITRSALPLRALETGFAVDSTGFGCQQFYRHFSAKYGHDQNYRDFLKLHAMIGVRTNVITAAEVTHRDVHDYNAFAGLVETTAASGFAVERVSADKAYSGRTNVEAVARIGASPLIPFRSNAKAESPHAPASPVWTKLFHYFSLRRDEFLAEYHERSNAESTFSALKRKFGDILRSKTPIAQRNELLLKVLCHNIVCVIHEIHASGVEAMFPALCPITPAPAQQWTR